MLTTKKVAGFAIATAAAGLFAAGAANAASAVPQVAANAGKVHCLGANACRGQSDCATASNSCKGQNSCKGEGMKVLSLKECQAVGGTPQKKG